MNPLSSGYKVHISGTVQGVGFRPFVYSLATRLNLTGWVCNTTAGVDIEVYGSTAELHEFESILRASPPPLARVDEIHITTIEPSIYPSFTIKESLTRLGENIPISPDVGICLDCKEELFDPFDRRYRYPFINCTNCGPRFTIIQDVPYDRPNTTMQSFPLCPECLKEYHDPENRRFHAQPIACPICGPQLAYSEGDSIVYVKEEALSAARLLLKQGGVLAVKGIGGYHLACDASNLTAVQSLRIRKQRSEQPFALMSFTLSNIKNHVLLTTEEETLLESHQKPIVLLQKKGDNHLFQNCAPGQNSLGFMLPYTPLHLLLIAPEPGFPEILVMTSGNISEEPIAFTDEEAFKKLPGLADAFLTHNRPIHTRVDDSVVRTFGHHLYPIRRSRGYAPDPLLLPIDLPEILGCGAELKNTFSLSKGKYIFTSHHIGDLENYETLRAFEEGITHYKRLFRLEPGCVATDMHPNYLSTTFGLDLAQKSKLFFIPVQHHHAHLAANLADNHWSSLEPAIGLIFDGTGYGLDGKIWGGEVLIGGYQSFSRRFHLSETPLPGGDIAIRNPVKTALAQLWSAGQEWSLDLPPVAALSKEERAVTLAQLEHKMNTPMSTSMGRLFDAVSSLAGVRQHSTYEGQAAIELETLCDPNSLEAYKLHVSQDTILTLGLFPQIIQDLKDQTPLPLISARFHNALARVCLSCCETIRLEQGISVVALSGGVWQNMTLLQKTSILLSQAGFEVLTHHQVPTNDGGISVGQVLIAAYSKF